MNIIMKLIRYLFIAYICFSSPLFAAGEPLNVGIVSFVPPFIMQGANKESSGFDVDMMNSICKMIDRTCVYHIMRFNQLLPSVAKGTLDVAVSSITITPGRQKIVNFSVPYMLGSSRFLTKKVKPAPAFSLEALSGKNIGVASGTIFSDQIHEMAIKDPNIKEYPRLEDQLDALNSGQVDYILVDSPTATYWDANSADSLMAIGPPYPFGDGLGVAINPNEVDLLSAINDAMLKYQNGPEYKMNYDKYLTHFDTEIQTKKN